jgi:hypothetical protein
MKAVDQSLPKSQTDGLGTFWTLPPEAICTTLHLTVPRLLPGYPNMGLLEVNRSGTMVERTAQRSSRNLKSSSGGRDMPRSRKGEQRHADGVSMAIMQPK